MSEFTIASHVPDDPLEAQLQALQIRLKMQRDWVRRTESEIEALQKRIDGQ